MNSNSLMPNRKGQDISNKLKAEALRLGFSACGLAKAAPVDFSHYDTYSKWIKTGKHADMGYLEKYEEMRMDPRKLHPGSHTVISLALNYYPEKRLNNDQYQFALYVYGKDYHDVMKQKIRELWSSFCDKLDNTDNSIEVDRIRESCKICVDTAPILERYWAWKSGIGWIGRNKTLIIPHKGSFFFLGEILTELEFDEYDTPMQPHCGTCHKCIDACPMHALGESIDARLCLSYLTIEHKGEFDEKQSSIDSINKNKNVSIYGCDCCQLACPHNKAALPTQVEEFKPSEQFLSMRPDDWNKLTKEEYQQLFRGSAVKRAKYEGLMRNISHLGNHK